MTTVAPTRYTFLGHPVPESLLPRLVDGLTLFDTWQGAHVVRHRTQEYVGIPNRRQVAS